MTYTERRVFIFTFVRRVLLFYTCTASYYYHGAKEIGRKSEREIETYGKRERERGTLN